MGYKDIEELIKIARRKPLKEESEFEDPNITIINSFVTAKGIESSNVAVPAKLIYDQFKVFSNLKIAKNLFFSIFSRLFASKRLLGFSCYMITPVSMGLPPNYTIYKDPRFSKKAKKLEESKYVGVYPDVSGGFVARIKTEHGFRMIGHFYDEKEAARAYDKAAKLVFAEHAVLNFGDSDG